MSKYLVFAIPSPVQITQFVSHACEILHGLILRIIHISEEKEVMSMKLYSKTAQ